MRKLGRFTTRYRELSAETYEVTDPMGKVYRIDRPLDGVYEVHQPGGLTELTQYDVLGRCLAKVVYETEEQLALSSRAYSTPARAT